MRTTKQCVVLGFVVAIALSTIAVVHANNANDSDEMSITVSPNTLVLDSAVVCVSVHSNIPLSSVQRYSLDLSGVVPYLVKADSLGHLVAKFNADRIRELVDDSTGTSLCLTLSGTLLDGTPFSVSDTIVVKAK